jgi:hypothetical protein
MVHPLVVELTLPDVPRQRERTTCTANRFPLSNAELKTVTQSAPNCGNRSRIVDLSASFAPPAQTSRSSHVRSPFPDL